MGRLTILKQLVKSFIYLLAYTLVEKGYTKNSYYNKLTKNKTSTQLHARKYI